MQQIAYTTKLNKHEKIRIEKKIIVIYYCQNSEILQPHWRHKFKKLRMCTMINHCLASIYDLFFSKIC